MIIRLPARSATSVLLRIKEACRICRKKLIITASNKGWMVPIWTYCTLPKFKKVVHAVTHMAKTGSGITTSTHTTERPRRAAQAQNKEPAF